MSRPRKGAAILAGALLILGVARGSLAAQVTIFAHPDGTSHWYQAVHVASGITWEDAHTAAARAGGYLATITSAGENAAVFDLVDQARLWRTEPSGELVGPWLGGLQAPASREPDGGWQWAELEPFGFAGWASGQPDNDARADRVHFGGDKGGGRTASWGDAPATALLKGYVIEYSGPTVLPSVGLQLHDARAAPGYTLHNPLTSKDTYLVDRRGRAIRTWTSSYFPGAAACLEPSGHLLRAGRTDNPVFAAGGTGGIIEQFDWQGQRVWSFTYSAATHCAHHDFARMPNGNLLLVAWEFITGGDAIAAGRDPRLLSMGALWPDKIVEVEPTATGGRIVWEWRAWDHLIQDHDATKANYGVVGNHPELIDLNYPNGTPNATLPDWHHINAIDYNAELDQIMVSVREFSELWIIDHSTTTAEARGHTGGRSGRGGDLLYRWGNPAAYRAGTTADQKLFVQHDTQWVRKGLPGAGNVLVFNNGQGRPGGNHSSIDELVLPAPTANGTYPRPGAAWGPVAPTWSYVGTPPRRFYSSLVSGAQRLANGNTVGCAGVSGVSFEVTASKEVVWVYRNPVTAVGPTTQGTVPTDSVGPTGTPVFRSNFYPPDFPGFLGKTLTPGAPLEKHASVLLVDGSRVAVDAPIGTTVDLTLRSAQHPGAIYIVATAMTEGILALDNRFIRLGHDLLLVLSARGGAPGTFLRYIGTLDGTGEAQAGIALPHLPSLAGLELSTAFVVNDPGRPSNLGLISNTVKVRVTR